MFTHFLQSTFPVQINTWSPGIFHIWYGPFQVGANLFPVASMFISLTKTHWLGTAVIGGHRQFTLITDAFLGDNNQQSKETWRFGCYLSTGRQGGSVPRDSLR